MQCAQVSHSAAAAGNGSAPWLTHLRLVSQQYSWHRGATCNATHRQHRECSLTRRSSGAPTAGHQARAGGTRYIFASPGLASCRRHPLSSTLGSAMEAVLPCVHTARPSGLASVSSLANLGGHTPQLPRLCGCTSLSLGSRLHRRAGPRERGPLTIEASQVLGPPPWPARERAVDVAAVRHLLCHCPWRIRAKCPLSAALPNPSFKPSPNGVPRRPGLRYCVHLRSPGPRVTPLVPA